MICVLTSSKGSMRQFAVVSTNSDYPIILFEGNENLHFKLDPSRGTNTPKLIVQNPFSFESGTQVQQQYHLVVHVIDDNLKYSKAIKPKTGTAVIDIYVRRTSMPPAPTSSEVKSYRI